MSFTLVIFALTCLSVGWCIKCPSEFINLNDKCYHFSKQEATWLRAAQDCIRMNSSLVSIETKQESQAIHDHMVKLKNIEEYKEADYWLSGVQLFRNKIEKFVWTSTWENLKYTNWCRYEPNNSRYKGEHCLIVRFDVWNKLKTCWLDIVCTEPSTSDFHPIHYICETEPIDEVQSPVCTNKNGKNEDNNKIAYEIHIEQV